MALTKEEVKARENFEKLKDEQQRLARTGIFVQMPTKIAHLGSLLKVLTLPDIYMMTL